VSEPEKFLSRWARLKREAAETPDAAAPAAEGQEPKEAKESRDAAPAAEAIVSPAPDVEFDLSTLPPIETITATTDIRAFLAPGVPTELKRAALRRAWVADPAIRDFVGIAENQWDFNDPNAIPGFGSLGPLDDVRRLVAQVLGEVRDEEAAAGAEHAEKTLAAKADSTPYLPEPAATTGEVAPAQGAQETSAPPPDVQCNDTDAALQLAQSETDALPHAEQSTRRGHGGALPK